MAMRHAVLGAAKEGPATRYELLIRLRRDFPLHRFSTGGVYSAIEKLVKSGHLTPQEPEGDADTAECVITPLGVSYLRGWILKTPRPGLFRDDLQAQITYSEIEDLPILEERVRRRLEWVNGLMERLRGADEGLNAASGGALRAPWRVVRVLVVRSVALSVLDGFARGLRRAHAEIVEAQVELPT